MTEAEFMDLVPEGWLKRLCHAWLEMHMEMPLQFVVLTGMAVVGNLLGYKVWCKVAGDAFIYPNLNALLVSPAGLCRRSHGTKTIISIAEMAGVNVYRGKATREGLLDELQECPNLLVYADEIAEIVNRREYQQSMTSFLPTVLLTEPKTLHERTRGGGKVVLDRPMLTCVFTGAADWFHEAMPRAASGGGFLRRFIKCCMDDRERFYINYNDTTDGSEIKARLAIELNGCVKPLQGRLGANESVLAWTHEDYLENERKLRDTHVEWLVPHLSGKPSDIARVAMILVACAGETQLTVERLEQAKRLVNYYESTLGLLHESIGGGNRDVGVERTVLKLVGDEPIAHGMLMLKVRRATGMGVKEIGNVLRGMVEMGTVKRIDGPGGKLVWPPLGWRRGE